jgi:hypothetical protein
VNKSGQDQVQPVPEEVVIGGINIIGKKQMSLTLNFNDLFDMEVGAYVDLAKEEYLDKKTQKYKTNNEILNLDPIKFWKDHMDKFKFLFQIATDVLPAPAQSAASERGFSQMTSIIDSGRVSLGGDTGAHLSQLKIRFNSKLLYGARNDKTKKHLKKNDDGGIKYPPFGTVGADAELTIDFDLLEELADSDYEDDVVEDDEDSDDDYVDEGLEDEGLEDEVDDSIDNQDRISTVNKRQLDDKTKRPRKKSAYLTDHFV